MNARMEDRASRYSGVSSAKTVSRRWRARGESPQRVLICV